MQKPSSRAFLRKRPPQCTQDEFATRPARTGRDRRCRRLLGSGPQKRRGGSVMFKKPNCPIIAIEEHYWDPELAKHYTGAEAGRGGETDKRLYDLGELRLKEMDEAGIDIQVLSHGAPSTQKLPADIAAELTRAGQRPAGQGLRRQPEALRRLRRAADRRSGGRRRRARARGQQARLQGRHDPRHVERRIPRRQEILADLRARREARRADLFASLAAERDGDGNLLPGLRQGLPAGGAPGLGLHGGDRDAGDPAGALRRVREASEPEDHSRPFRRDAAVPGLAHRFRAQAARGRSR